MKSHIPKDVEKQIERLKKKYNTDHRNALHIMSELSKVGAELDDIKNGMMLNIGRRKKWR